MSDNYVVSYNVNRVAKDDLEDAEDEHDLKNGRRLYREVAKEADDLELVAKEAPYS